MSTEQVLSEIDQLAYLINQSCDQSNEKVRMLMSKVMYHTMRQTVCLLNLKGQVLEINDIERQNEKGLLLWDSPSYDNPEAIKSAVSIAASGDTGICEVNQETIALYPVKDSTGAVVFILLESHYSEKRNLPPAPVLNVLVAEDSPTNQIIANEFLLEIGYHPDIVNNGQEALDAMAKKQYDVIFMDAQMPVMGGLEATIAIREKYGQTPYIVAMTGDNKEEDRTNYLSSGMNHYIPKPVTIEALKEAFSNVNTVSDERLLHVNEVLVEAFAENESVMNKYISSFLRDIDSQLKQLEADDLNSVKKSAHSIKGIVSYCKVDSINQTLIKIEEAENIEEVQKLLNTLKPLIASLKEKLISMQKV